MLGATDHTLARTEEIGGIQGPELRREGSLAPGLPAAYRGVGGGVGETLQLGSSTQDRRSDSLGVFELWEGISTFYKMRQNVKEEVRRQKRRTSPMETFPKASPSSSLGGAVHTPVCVGGREPLC